MCNTTQGFYGENDRLSRSSKAVISAVTQREYSCEPAVVPNEATRFASIIATALRAVLDECSYTTQYHESNSELNQMVVDEEDLIRIAYELENYNVNV